MFGSKDRLIAKPYLDMWVLGMSLLEINLKERFDKTFSIYEIDEEKQTF